MASVINASSSGAGGLVSSGDSSGVLQLQNNGSTSVTLDTSGNVGIGTSSPSTYGKLAVVGSGFNGGNANFVSTSSGNSITVTGVNGAGVNDVAYYNFTDGTNNAFIGLTGTNATAGALRFATGTSPTERMRIDTSGNVGIGTSSPSAKLTIASNAGGYALQTAGTVNDYFGMSVYNSNAGSSARSYLQLGNDANQYATFISLNSSTNTAIGGANSLNIYQGLTAPLTFSTAGTERMRIDSSGNLLIGYTSSNGSYKLQVNSQIFATSSTIATSDARYKENVEELSGALDIVKSLRPVSFDWKVHPIHNFDTKTKTVGFLAQDVQQTLAGKPYLNSIIKTNECVIEPEVKDENGTVTKEAVTEEFLGIAEGNMISILTAAIKELKAEFDAYVIAHP